MNPKKSRMRIFVIFERLVGGSACQNKLPKLHFSSFIPITETKSLLDPGFLLGNIFPPFFSIVLSYSNQPLTPFAHPNSLSLAHVSQPQLAAARAPCLHVRPSAPADHFVPRRSGEIGGPWRSGIHSAIWKWNPNKSQIQIESIYIYML